jgi:hypothetical protein
MTPASPQGSLLVKAYLDEEYNYPGITFNASGNWFAQGYMWDKTFPPQVMYAIDWQATSTYEAGMKLFLKAEPGTQTISATSNGFEFGTADAQIFAGEVTEVQVPIYKPALYDISGEVRDYEGSPVGLDIAAGGRFWTITNAENGGAFTLHQLPANLSRWLSNWEQTQNHITSNYNFPLISNITNFAYKVWTIAQFNTMANGVATYDPNKKYAGVVYRDAIQGNPLAGVTLVANPAVPLYGYLDTNYKVNSSLTSTSSVGTVILFDTSADDYEITGTDGVHYFNTGYIGGNLGGIMLTEVHHRISPK